MTAAELRAVFANCPAPFFAGGANYAKPLLSWVTGRCYDAFRARYFDDALAYWKVRWECRDFARAFACFAQECNALTPDAACPAGEDILAMGEIWFIPDRLPDGTANDGAHGPRIGHAVNALVCENGVDFFEPQTGAMRPLTTSEYASAYFIRF